MTKKRTFFLVILMGQIYLKYLKFTHLRLFFIFLSAKYIESFARYFPKVNSQQSFVNGMTKRNVRFF